MKSIIRPMSVEDQPYIQKLSEQLGYMVSILEINQRFQELLSLPHHGLFVLESDSPKGWIHLEKISNLIMPTKIHIKALVIDENERGKGFGKELIKFAKAWAKESGVSTIYLSTNITRDRAHAFYLQSGFTNVKTSHFFEMNI